MTPVTRVKCSSAALAAALLLGLGTPAAAAHAPGRDAHRVPFTAATVTDHADGTSTITWTAPGTRTVTIRSEGRTVARGGATGTVTVATRAAADRHWFDLVPDRGTPLRLADRLVRLQGTANLRDAGGYRTRDGQWVRMGEVYRSDALDKLTDADLAALRRLGVRTVLDLRTESERAAAPDRVPAGTRHVVADVLAGGGVLFHCTAGKDRTGWAEAALLTALGVPEETVMADYLASDTYRAAADEAILSHLPPAQAAVYKPLLDVRPAYLNASFDQVERDFGSFRAYLRKGAGLDAHELKSLKRDLLVG